MRLVISRSRWDQIFQILERRKPRELYLSGICMSGRYCVLGASGTMIRPRRESPGQFCGVLFVHRGEELRNFWLTREELKKLKKLRRRQSGIVTGVLVADGDCDLALYPAWLSSRSARDMRMEDEDGFACAQPFSALRLLLPPRHPRRGPV